ncbi:hypothetical protein CEE39_00385 [bacterium (candidate division B38) B3_B38]|nr:MAG: hypothetical protein CEE39_00385 [bacterium (candidate division B38) B3_B38]
MKKPIIILLVVVIVVVIFLISLLSDRDKGIEVYQYTVEKRDLMSIVSASGIIEPRIKVNISSNVIGEIVKLAVKEGQRVNKGDFLLQIDPQQYEAEVRRLKAYLKMSQINVEQAEVNLRDARNNLERVKSLFQKEFVSQMELEAAQVKYDSAEVQLKSAREEVAQARASLERVEDQLKKTTFTAPMSGIVSKLNAEEGETVITGTMNNPGTVIMTIADMSEVLSTVNVDETEINKVRLGQKAKVTVDAIEGKEYQGEVMDIATSATKEGDVSVFQVKIAMEDPDQNLKPGMTSRAQIETDFRSDIFAVPLQSVVEREIEVIEEGKKKKVEKDVVFLIEENKAKMVPVTTGISDDTDVEILSGVEEGDRVITGPYRNLKNLKNGDLVKIKEEEMEGESLEVSINVS